ncbi:hypothetical protein GLOIN_2v1763195 [Rhizophagus clarus]|uniref:Uncharacterized protein n=1 Tax=Rhizophagus clarus TaxID=94130 RepID=A0A8H3L0D2_9GLOM|nr:hypothetical protein GLOIN_2v1763195 [Rhizophagus clarus]
MWLEREQNLSGRIPEESNQFANQVQALPSINPVSYSLPQVTPVSQPAFTKDDMQKAIQEALAQQKTKNQALSEEGMRDYHISEYLKNLGFLSKEEIDCDYPVKPFQRPRPQRNDNSSRIDRMEEGLNETRESVNQLTEEFQKLNICKPVARSNFNRSYFTPIKPINPQYAFPDSNNGEDNNWWTGYEPEDTKYEASEKKIDNASEFDGFNLATAEAFGWKVDKPSKFLVKSNFEYISEALGWYKDVAITLRDEKGKPIVTIIGNYACIDNGEPKPMLWLGVTGIRKVKDISDPTNN